MSLVPLPGIPIDQLLEVLHSEATNLSNLRSGPGTAIDRFNAYLKWSSEVVMHLGPMLRPGDLEHLVTTPRYWTLQTLDPAARQLSLAGFVDLEVSERLRTFELERDSLRTSIERWRARQGWLIVADTNVYLHHDQYFDEVDWAALVGARLDGVHLVLPLLVVDELDRHKRGQRGKKVSSTNSEEVRTRARVTLKKIDESMSPGASVTIHPSRFPERGQVTAEVLLDPADHVRLEDADAEIVDRAVAVKQLAQRDVTVVTFDVGMKMRAQAAGLRVVRLSES